MSTFYNGWESEDVRRSQSWYSRDDRCPGWARWRIQFDLTRDCRIQSNDTQSSGRGEIGSLGDATGLVDPVTIKPFDSSIQSDGLTGLSRHRSANVDRSDNDLLINRKRTERIRSRGLFLT